MRLNFQQIRHIAVVSLALALSLVVWPSWAHATTISAPLPVVTRTNLVQTNNSGIVQPFIPAHKEARCGLLLTAPPLSEDPIENKLKARELLEPVANQRAPTLAGVKTSGNFADTWLNGHLHLAKKDGVKQFLQIARLSVLGAEKALTNLDQSNAETLGPVLPAYRHTIAITRLVAKDGIYATRSAAKLIDPQFDESTLEQVAHEIAIYGVKSRLISAQAIADIERILIGITARV
jgi:hypothetical protein